MKIRKFILPVISAVLLVVIICLLCLLQNTKNRYELVMRNNDSEFLSELFDIANAMGKDVTEGSESEYNNTQVIRIRHCRNLLNYTKYKEYTSLQFVLSGMEYYCIKGEFHKFSGKHGLAPLIIRLQINPGDQDAANKAIDMLKITDENWPQ